MTRLQIIVLALLALLLVVVANHFAGPPTCADLRGPENCPAVGHAP